MRYLNASYQERSVAQMCQAGDDTVCIWGGRRFEVCSLSNEDLVAASFEKNYAIYHSPVFCSKNTIVVFLVDRTSLHAVSFDFSSWRESPKQPSTDMRKTLHPMVVGEELPALEPLSQPLVVVEEEPPLPAFSGGVLITTL
jgi:hypothetical protein